MIAIAWDVDDVLNDLMRSWLEKKWTKEVPDCRLGYSDIKVNPPHEIFGVSKDEYIRSLLDFRLSRDFKEMAPNSEVLGWFEKNGDGFMHLAVTATPLEAASVATEWVIEHFGRWIRTFHFAPAGRKAEFLKWLGRVAVIIDDSQKNVADAERLGIDGVLFPRPWNESQWGVKETLDDLTMKAKRRAGIND